MTCFLAWWKCTGQAASQGSDLLPWLAFCRLFSYDD
jgi:hypothetical protein